MTDKASIGVAIGFGGAAVFAFLAALFDAIQPHLPAIHRACLWLFTPQMSIGIVTGMVCGAAAVAIPMLTKEARHDRH